MWSSEEKQVYTGREDSMEERLLEILRIALAHQVTDIHFSLNEDGRTSVEMRVDGEIRQLRSNRDDIRLFRYLIYRSNLDVSSILLPQTGSFEMNVDGRPVSLRFAIVSGFHQKSGVLRILSRNRSLTVDMLSMQTQAVRWLSHVTDHRSGLVIFSGPTGSGKTTTLYTLLDACQGKKIYTLEDPVEVVHENYVQLQINEKQLTYADGIRQLMRQDPDIIMIGEIRDSSAAAMAVRSALTGHLVVTTLHSFRCTGAIERMIDLGIERGQLSEVLRGVANQRLYVTEGRRRTGIYEIMDAKETAFYFRNGHTSDSFITLEDSIRQAVALGILPEDQARADLA